MELPGITAAARSAAAAPGLHLSAELLMLVAAAAVVLGIGYLISVAVNPYCRCRRCLGTGKTKGFLGGMNFCRACGGAGMIPRAGTLLFSRRAARGRA